MVIVGYSKELNIPYAVEEVSSKFTHPKLILFFAPVSVFTQVSRCFHEKFASSNVVGVTTYFAYTTDGIVENGLAAVSFEDGISCSCGVIGEIDRYPSKFKQNVKNAIEKIPEQNTICLEFMTAFSFNEDVVLNTLNSVCKKKSIPVVGGCASTSPDMLKNPVDEVATYVSLNGAVYKNSCVFMFIHNMNGKIAFVSENIFKPIDHSFLVTSIDYARHIIYKVDGIPVRDALAKTYRCLPKDVPLLLHSYPIGRIVGKNYFIADIVKFNDDGSVIVNTPVYNNTRMRVFASQDYHAITKNTFKRMANKIAKPSFTLHMNYLMRTMFYLQEQFLNDWARELGKNTQPSLGFSSLGEQLFNCHLNQVFCAILFE